MHGLKLTEGIPRSLVSPWNLEVVLPVLRLPPYYSLKALSLKYLTPRMIFLVAVTSARRASKIRALRSDTLRFSSTSVMSHIGPDFITKVVSSWHCNQLLELSAMHADADAYLRQLCVCATLSAYLNAIKVLCASTGPTQLFLCYGGTKPGSPVSKRRFSAWSKLWCLTLTSAEIFRLLRESRVIRLGVKLLLGRKQLELTLIRFATLPRGRQTVFLRSITVLIWSTLGTQNSSSEDICFSIRNRV